MLEFVIDDDSKNPNDVIESAGLFQSFESREIDFGHAPILHATGIVDVGEIERLVDAIRLQHLPLLKRIEQFMSG